MEKLEKHDMMKFSMGEEPNIPIRTCCGRMCNLSVVIHRRGEDNKKDVVFAICQETRPGYFGFDGIKQLARSGQHKKRTM